MACSPQPRTVAAEYWANAKLRFQTVQRFTLQSSAQALLCARDLLLHTDQAHLNVVFFTFGLAATLAIDRVMEFILSSWMTDMILIFSMVRARGCTLACAPEFQFRKTKSAL